MSLAIRLPIFFPISPIFRIFFKIQLYSSSPTTIISILHNFKSTNTVHEKVIITCFKMLTEKIHPFPLLNSLFVLVYFSFNIRRKILRDTPMLLAPAIIISPFITPYTTHSESPAINEIMSHFETSSVFLVQRDFLI